VEEGTRNVTPVNCFNLRVLDDIPGATTFYAMAFLADGKGEMQAVLAIERLDTYEEIYRIEKTLVFPDRLLDTRFLARIRGCTLPVEGHYEVSLNIGGEWIAHRKFRVQKKGVQK
jgi:hypothetical protein